MDFESLLRDLELEDIDLIDFDDINPDNNAKTMNTQQSNDEKVQELLDIVFCIDVTQDMAERLPKIKLFLKGVQYHIYKEAETKTSHSLRQLRIKLISFRDCYCDGSFAIEQSEFFMLPEQDDEFGRFVTSLEAKGGRELSKNALEAIVLAINSDWVEMNGDSNEVTRKMIFVISNASAHPLERSSKYSSEYYPLGMPRDYDFFYELYEKWSRYDTKNLTRLLLCVPEDEYPWLDMEQEFRKCALMPESIFDSENWYENMVDFCISSLMGGCLDDYGYMCL